LPKARASISPASRSDAEGKLTDTKMALIKTKPTSPGRRFVVKADRSHLHKGEPVHALTSSQNRTGARNNQGRLTTRHKGGGHRQRYRVVDFLRNKDGIPGRVERLEYDPNRSAHLALVLYADGERRYILAPKGVTTGDAIASGADSAIKPGNALALRNIPLGTQIHNVELKPGRGGQIARSAGTSAQLVAREGMYATIRLRSTETRKVHIDCRATLGELSNDEHSLRNYGKAGAKRWRGIRPTVRGVVMNPVDHPHGGGEGKSGQGNPHPVSPWGWKTKGKKTRTNKRTSGLIIRRRN
jgi:large subunit ribosomal protein L2